MIFNGERGSIMVTIYIQAIRLRLVKMGCRLMQLRDENAVSEVIGIALVLVIASGAISAIVFWGVPYMAEKKATVALDSALFQLDVMGDIVDESLSEGAFEFSGGTFGNSKTVNLKLYNGELSLDDKGERFVIYYPVYKTVISKPEEMKFKMFEFDVSDFEPYSFYIKISNVDLDDYNDKGWLNFHIENLSNGDETDVLKVLTDCYKPGNSNYVEVAWTPGQDIPKLSDSVKITITYIHKSPLIVPKVVEYGYIWLFDVGSITYESITQSGTYRAIMENGCIFSAHNQVFTGFFNEPRYWTQKLLNDTAITTIGILQIKRDPDGKADAISSRDAFDIKMSMKQTASTVRVDKIGVYGAIKVKIYGDDAAVAAWRFYYTYKLGFIYNEASGYLENDFFLDYLTEGKDLRFSLYNTICYVNMEVKS